MTKIQKIKAALWITLDSTSLNLCVQRKWSFVEFQFHHYPRRFVLDPVVFSSEVHTLFCNVYSSFLLQTQEEFLLIEPHLFP